MGPWPDYDTVTAVKTQAATTQTLLGLDSTWLLAALAGFGLSLWRQARQILFRAVSLLVTSYDFGDGLDTLFCKYVSNPDQGFRRTRSGIRSFTLRRFRNKELKKRMGYITEWFNAHFTLYWKGQWPILISYRESNNEMSGASEVTRGGSSNKKMQIRFIRGTFDIDNLLKDLLTSYNASHHHSNEDRFFIRHVFGSRGHDKDQRSPAVTGAEPSRADGPEVLLYATWDEIGDVDDKESSNNLSLSPEAEGALVELQIWRKYEQWFRERGIPWKLSWLLYGPPGTGKTSLARGVGKENDMPIFSFDLSSMTNQDMISEWDNMLGYAPCIALIEDVDNTFDGRTNITNGTSQGLTFDCLLNCLDGITQNDGLLAIITTNKIDSLDRALGIPEGAEGRSSRPGRIDKAILMGPPDAVGRLKIATRILCDWPDLIEQVVADGGDDTGAQFQRRCCDIAEKMFKERTMNGEFKK